MLLLHIVVKLFPRSLGELRNLFPTYFILTLNAHLSQNIPT